MLDQFNQLVRRSTSLVDQSNWIQSIVNDRKFGQRYPLRTRIFLTSLIGQLKLGNIDLSTHLEMHSLAFENLINRHKNDNSAWISACLDFNPIKSVSLSMYWL